MYQRLAQKYQSISDNKGSYLRPEVSPKGVPAPYAGWNNMDPLANMQPQYATSLVNWIPRPGWVELRGGFNIWSFTGTANPVESLLVYRSETAAVNNEKLFAVANNLFQEVTAYGSPAAAYTGTVTNNRWNYVNFTTPANTYLVACNGSDPVVNYNGTTWTNPSITGSGLGSSNNFIQVYVHQQRLWFVEANSTRMWFLAVQSISGTATVLDVGPYIDKGGYINAITSLTIDGGNGPSTLLCAVTSKGQLVVYAGTDPTSVSAFALVGVFNLPPPIGRRCFTQIGSDVAYISTQGLLPLTKTLPFNPAADRSVSLSLKIQNQFVAAAQAYFGNFGWECQRFDAQTLMVVNVPITTNSNQTQYVMNALTGAWCSITGWNANCFAIFNENLFFGDNNGNVCMAYTGKTDTYNSINAALSCAWNFFESPGRVKNITMVKPYVVADGQLTPTMAVDSDFVTSTINAPVQVVKGTGALWDTGVWDTAIWGATSTFTNALWYSVNALGTALSLRMNVNYGGSNSSIGSGFGYFDQGQFDSAIFDGTGVTTPGGSLPTLQVVAFETLQQPGSFV